MSELLGDCFPDVAREAFATFDPPDQQLGSGGGTAHLLHEAWRASGTDLPLSSWCADEQRILLHGGGESRRLPAYANVGKLFIPMPTLRWERGQRLGQTLLDLNLPFLKQASRMAGPDARLLIASGDVLLRANTRIDPLPNADVVLLGMWASPDVAQNYGVMFVDRNNARRLETFLQKPTPDEIRERSRDFPFLIDIGAWLLSERAIRCLLNKCGWNDESGAFQSGSTSGNYDLYGQWALHLGESPKQVDKDVSKLSVAIAPVSGGEFYHFGTTKDVIDSMYALQNIEKDQTRLGPVSSLAQPRQFVIDSEFKAPLRRQANEWLWVDNASIPASWTLGERNVLTGVPANDWKLKLPDGACLDFVPVGDEEFVVRFYGFRDRFRGPIAHENTSWLEKPAMDWFQSRGISLADAKIDENTDMQSAQLFPVISLGQLNEIFIQWLLTPSPDTEQSESRKLWLNSRRLSARQIGQESSLSRLMKSRSGHRSKVIPLMAARGARSVFYKLDLMDTAEQFASSTDALPEPFDASENTLLAIHDRMFRAEVRKLRGDDDWRDEEQSAFSLLNHAIVSRHQQEPAVPEYHLAADQIVWARSPARVDFAGGWTDTPPYCLENGGAVTNIALNLNGQPPIQAFARRCEDRTITIRSIDLGINEVLATYDDVAGFRVLGSGFSVAKAALALCGFHPEFHKSDYASLADQLDKFGGGVDISMLAAIPKGSGLGTSSILAGTVLAALGELCGFRWDTHEIAARVSSVEQMLGSGGGWQDQLGGLLRGAKLITTSAGFDQTASVHWLPNDFFESAEFGHRGMLYYTGITRVAHDVLGEIVRGMFLNEPSRLAVLSEIGQNGLDCFDAIQRCDVEAFGKTIARSWELNRNLDSGTNPPEVQKIIERIRPHATAFKLSGAGGGGFLYILAKDQEHAVSMRRSLEEDPPNDRARFVEMSISRTGLEVTRS